MHRCSFQSLCHVEAGGGRCEGVFPSQMCEAIHTSATDPHKKSGKELMRISHHNTPECPTGSQLLDFHQAVNNYMSLTLRAASIFPKASKASSSSLRHSSSVSTSRSGYHSYPPAA